MDSLMLRQTVLKLDDNLETLDVLALFNLEDVHDVCV